MASGRSGTLNPVKLWGNNKKTAAYHQLPSFDRYPPSQSGASSPVHKFRAARARIQRPSLRVVVSAGFVLLLVFAVLGPTHIFRPSPPPPPPPPAPPPSSPPPTEVEPIPYPWGVFRVLHGYFNGVKKLVSYDQYKPENPSNSPPRYRDAANTHRATSSLPLSLRRFDPYPNYQSPDYTRQHHPVESCYLDLDSKMPPPDVFVYPGVPQSMPMPVMGSYELLDLPQDVCFDRFGRLGPYGYGYGPEEGGLIDVDPEMEHVGVEELWELQPKPNLTAVNWGAAQKECRERNQQRFREKDSERRGEESSGKTHVPRTALLLRAWTNYDWDKFETISVRAMVNELSLKSGGEYDVHILLQVKNESIPIWESNEVYQQTIREHTPKDFWDMTTLWTQQQMEEFYPGPFGEAFGNPSEANLYGVYRSAHFVLQWFSQTHPEYDYIWNWEMDVRYTGHYYDFFSKLGKWGADQPRKGLWERSSKFWIPAYHGNWTNFTNFVEEELHRSGTPPTWGPVSFPHTDRIPDPPGVLPEKGYYEDQYEWGVGEPADLLVFNPLFNPDSTNWVFRNDISGYSLDLPKPPRRAAIITVARLSKRLLGLMHDETAIMKHTAFPEMWPATVAYHHSLKAAYVPHPLYFDREWPLDYMEQIFNYPEQDINSPFGWGEHNLLGSSFYFNAQFSGVLWRRWLGKREEGEGGAEEEKAGSGRMCIRSSLHHPIKFD